MSGASTYVLVGCEPARRPFRQRSSSERRSEESLPASNNESVRDSVRRRPSSCEHVTNNGPIKEMSFAVMTAAVGQVAACFVTARAIRLVSVASQEYWEGICHMQPSGSLIHAGETKRYGTSLSPVLAASLPIHLSLLAHRCAFIHITSHAHPPACH